MATLHLAVWEGLPENVTFQPELLELRPDGRVFEKEESNCKCKCWGKHWAFSRSRKETSTIGAK